LTSAQSLFALALIANFDLSVREAMVLMATFLLQLFVPGTEARLVFAAVYLVASVALLAGSRSRRDALRQVPAMVREALLLMGTFLVQAFFPSVEVRLAMAGLYFVAGVGLIVLSRERRQAVIRLPGQLREIVWRRAAATG
jgi:hypothetical protein